jgi:hypothetical protein
MKKLLIIFIAFMFLAGQSTWSVTWHYCANHLSSVELVTSSTNKNPSCSYCKTNKPCCEDVVQVVEGQQYHPQSLSFIYKAPFFSVLYTFFIPTANQLQSPIIKGFALTKLIDDGDIPIFLRHRQFRL